MLLQTGALPYRCDLCRGPNGPALRAQWGCDQPIPAKEARNILELAACGLSGREPLLRCPNVTMPRTIGYVLTSFAQRQHGLFMEPGGLGDQSAWLIDAHDCIAGIMHHQKPERGSGGGGIQV